MALPVAEPRQVEVPAGQRRVLDQFLIDGADNETIARRLGLAHGTVKTHMRHLLRSFDCHTRAALAVLILTEQAVPVKPRRRISLGTGSVLYFESGHRR